MKKHASLSKIFVSALIFTLAFTTTAGASNYQQDDQAAHGKYIATIAGCTACHTPYKADYQKPPQELTFEQIQAIAFDDHLATDQNRLLAGGRPFDLGPAGILFTRNITPDEETGIGAWSDDQLKLAIKTGIDNKGGVLFPVMPYHVYSGMADADLEAVIAYMRSVNTVSNPVPARTVPTEGMPTPPYQTGIVPPDASDKAARGAYLVNSVMGCTDCHTPVDSATGAPLLDKYLAGRQPYEGPWGIVYGGNITPDEQTGIGAWTDEEVKRSILSGIGRDGRRLILMPWYSYTALTPEDADAVVFYLKHVLPAVDNQIPAASLNPEFNVMASEAQNQLSTGNEPLSPILILAAGLGVILFVSLIGLILRRKSA
jgi:mono/diheme cytochrome c family protein